MTKFIKCRIANFAPSLRGARVISIKRCFYLVLILIRTTNNVDPHCLQFCFCYDDNASVAQRSDRDGAQHYARGRIYLAGRLRRRLRQGATSCLYRARL